MEKSILNNAIFNVLYKSLTVIFPLITISYASRLLGPVGIGNISSAQNIATYFVMFASLGIPQYGVRELARSKKDRRSCDKTFSELFIINLIASAICSLIYFIVIFQIDNFQNSLRLNLVFSVTVLLNIFNIDWVYRAFEQYRYIAIRSFLIKSISLILLVIFINDPKDIVCYASIVCFGTVGNYILNMINLRNFVSFRFNGLCIGRHIIPIFIFFASVIAVELYSLIDVTMLTWLTQSKNVGYYSNSSKVIKTIAATITAIGAVLLPRLSLYFNENRTEETEKVLSKVLKTIIFFAFPCTIGLIITADKIVLIAFGKDFLPVVNTLRILSPLIIMMPLSGGIGAQILQTTNNEKLYMCSVYMGAFTNFILNIIFIREFEQNGAAFASAITECLVTGVMLMFCSRIVKFKIDKRFLSSVGIASLIMGVLVCLMNKIFVDINIIMIFLSEVVIGVICYFIILFFLKNELLLEFIDRLHNKIKI